jgi:hypothetical protein
MATAIITVAEHAKKYKPIGFPFEIGKVWDFKVIGLVKTDFSEKVVFRQIVAPNGVKIAEEKPIPSGELAAALQLKNTILEIPEELKRLEKNIVVQTRNINEYAVQIQSQFPYREEVSMKRERLSELDRIILNKSKQEKVEKQTVPLDNRIKVKM